MSTLSRISTAVLLCLVLAAPAAASEIPTTLKFAVHPEALASGGTPTYSPLEYEVSGSVNEEVKHEYIVAMLPPNAEFPKNRRCSEYTAGYEGNFQTVYREKLTYWEFEHKGVIPGTMYEEKGDYLLCAYIKDQGVEHIVVESEKVVTVGELDGIHLSIEPETAVQGEAVSYKILGTDTTSKGEEIWAYARIPGTSKCQSTAEEEDSITGHILGAEIKGPTFEYKGAVPSELYESPGTYLACAYIVLAGSKPTIRAASSFTFVVISKLKHEEEVAAKHKAEEEAATTKRHEEEAAATKKREAEEEAAKRRAEEAAKALSLPSPPLSPAPVVTPTAPPVVAPAAPVVNPLTASQKLHAALAKCKKQYKHNKKKRVVCEKQAKKKYSPKPKQRR